MIRKRERKSRGAKMRGKKISRLKLSEAGQSYPDINPPNSGIAFAAKVCLILSV